MYNIGGIPNKFEIFQDFYYDENGVEISYQEALKLYSQMDADTKTDFEKYYKDETGYEIISRTGYNFDDPKFTVVDTGKTKKVKRKKKQSDGSIKYVETAGKVLITTKTITLPDGTTKTIENYTPQSTINAIKSKYAMEAYMKKNGMIIDPQWASYSAEEILQMVNEGVNIPQEIIDAANSIYQSSGANFETVAEGEGADIATSDETTEKEPFLDLIPKAEKKIRKCNENSEKIEDKVEDLLPEQQKKQKSFEKQMEAQRKSLKEFEEYVREWRALQNKVNNGEALSDSEARRYAEITGMLEDKNNSDNSNIDKREIAHNLNDINILAALGEKLANETIEIGETLADYTSKTNYKTTRKEIRGQIGFLAAIMAMARGERLAVESVKIGNETKEYTEETQKSVSEIASLMEIEGSIASTDNLKADKEEVQTPQDQKETEAVTQDSQTPASELPADTVENENEENPAAEEEAKTSEVTMEEDFIVNDDNVKDLINEAGDITDDLLEQTGRAVKTVITAKDDSAFAKNASKKIAKIVKEYQEEEARRQQEIETLENENKESYKKLEELTGKDKTDLEKELTGEENTAKNNEEDNTDEAVNEKSSKTKESDKEEIEERKNSIKSNNAKIAELNSEETNQIEDFKARTTKEKSRIQKSVPEENELLENNNKYAEETIPQDKERLDFTDNSGETLAKMGKYRIIVGLEQIMRWQYKKGIKNVAKGTISAGIGLDAMIISRTPVPKIAEKTTNKAVKEGTNAIDSLNQIDGQISAITGEETSQETYNNSKAEESNEQGTENNAEGTEATAAPEATAESATGEAVEKAAETQPAPVSQATEATEQTTEQLAEVQDSATQTLVDKNVSASVEDMQKAPVTQKEAQNSLEKTEDNTENKIGETSTKSTSTPKKEKKSPLEEGPSIEKENDKQEEKVKKIDSETAEDNKDSEAELKDTKKDKKQLEKEAKQLEKQMKKDQELIIKMTQESMEAALRQAEIITEYQALSAENEKMMAEDEAAQQAQTAQAPQQTDGQDGGGLLANNSVAIGGSQQSANNTDKLIQNGERITVLNGEFKQCENVITRNQTKMISLQKVSQNREKKYVKKTKTISKKIKAANKKEQEKQKRLAKQLAAVGIAENAFSLTLSTGTIYCIIDAPPLLSNPFTAALGGAVLTLGQWLVVIGTYGVTACGITKAAINLANGNLTAALMGLGTTAVSVASSFVPGVGEGTKSVLTAVSAGLNVVSSSAELVNNVRTVQGKEASGVFSKIATIAGTASALTSAAGTLGSLKDTASTFGKVAKIGTVVGTAMSSTSQMITEFGDSDSSFAKTLGTIGGAISLASSAYLVASAFSGDSSKSDDKKDENSDSENSTNDSNKTQDNSQTDQTKTEQKNQEKEMKKAETEAKKAEENAKKQEEKQDVKDAKKAKATQKELAKSVTDKKQISNIENGSSKEYAFQNDDELKSAIDFYERVGDKDSALKAQNELNNRQNYRNQQEKISAHNSKKMDKIKGVTDILGKGMDVAASFMKGNESQAQTKKKKGFAAGTLSEDAKKRLRRDKKRIATLSKSYRNRRYN